MVEPRTIDDLGIEPSIRWASDQEFLDQTLIKESSFVSKQTIMDVSSPFFKSEFDLLFETTQRYQHWAYFFAPKEYLDQKMRLFTFQLIPSPGSEELQQAQIQKIKDRVEAIARKRKRKQEAGEANEYAWQDKKEEEDLQKESKTLIDLLEYIHELDTLLTAVNSRRSQYAKG